MYAASYAAVSLELIKIQCIDEATAPCLELHNINMIVPDYLDKAFFEVACMKVYSQAGEAALYGIAVILF